MARQTNETAKDRPASGRMPSVRPLTARPFFLVLKVLWPVGAAAASGLLVYAIAHRSRPAPNASIALAPIAAVQTMPIAFAATKARDQGAPAAAPKGMVWIPGGEFSMGCVDPRDLPHGGHDAMPDARPIHRVYVDRFWMDQSEVTNDQFAAFVRATSYVTVAEHTPTAAEFPGSTAETSSPAPWCFRRRPNQSRSTIITAGGATCRERTGVIHRFLPPPSKGTAIAPSCRSLTRMPRLMPLGRQAAANRSRVGIRRPRRRGRPAYSWGDELCPGGKWMANIWQGRFPMRDTAQNGFAGIAPSASSRPMDMGSSIWPATSGSGAPTGIALTPTPNSRNRLPKSSGAGKQL